MWVIYFTKNTPFKLLYNSPKTSSYYFVNILYNIFSENASPISMFTNMGKNLKILFWQRNRISFSLKVCVFFFYLLRAERLFFVPFTEEEKLQWINFSNMYIVQLLVFVISWKPFKHKNKLKQVNLLTNTGHLVRLVKHIKEKKPKHTQCPIKIVKRNVPWKAGNVYSSTATSSTSSTYI